MALSTKGGLALLLTVIGSPSWAGDLAVAISGVRSPAGTLMVGLYDTAAGFENAGEG
jgi:hypothetical protein